MAFWLWVSCGLSTPVWALNLELLAPRATVADAVPSTDRDFVNVLGRTAPGAVVQVGGQAVTVFSSGVFARDRIALQPGRNTVLIEARLANGETAQQELLIDRVSPPVPVVWPTDRLFIDGASLRPNQTLRVAPGEAVEVAVRATPGQRVQARLPGQDWADLAETSPGRYRAALVAAPTANDTAPAAVQLRATATTLPADTGPRSLSVQTPAEVAVWPLNPDRLFVAGADGADLLHGLHEVRLGGPFLAELPAGTLFNVTGQQGEHLRVQLSPATSAWVAARALTPAPAGTAAPRVSFSSISVTPSADGDVLQVPLSAAVPYSVNVVADASGRHTLEVRLYGAHHATTWVSHRANLAVVREATIDQAAAGEVLLRVGLRSPRLWGWRVQRTPGALRITLRPAPVLASTGSPLAGLHVALEPGHGGPDNLGAVGATGVPEKEINRLTALALQQELLAAGARVTVVREGDDNPDLRERARRVLAAEAHIFISVHANAAETALGYFRVAGASTFYKHGTGRDLAAAVQQQVLKATGLDDFGLVGNFNYTPMRLVTWMPGVLVEQAFVSNPSDEARLLDPAFRASIAQAVRRGVEDFLRAY